MHGIDVVERNITIAQRHAATVGLVIQYELLSTSALVEQEATYDVVLNMEVVEHVPDRRVFMDECRRLVRPGGVMTIATINRTMLSWLFGIVGAEYILRWLPRGTHRWTRFVKPVELERDLGNYRIVDRTGVRVNPFNRQFALTPIEAVNYMLVARRPAPTDNDVPNALQ